MTMIGISFENEADRGRDERDETCRRKPNILWNNKQI